MGKNTIVKFYGTGYEPPSVLVYSVIAARYLEGWIFVRHTDRSTWEIAGGHIEEGETPMDAAGRELREETGAISFTLECVATYSVSSGGTTGYGRLYLAEVSELGGIPDISEIAERCICGDLPAQLTYPDIQPDLFRKCLARYREKKGLPAFRSNTPG